MARRTILQQTLDEFVLVKDAHLTTTLVGLAGQRNQRIAVVVQHVPNLEGHLDHLLLLLQVVLLALQLIKQLDGFGADVRLVQQEGVDEGGGGAHILLGEFVVLRGEDFNLLLDAGLATAILLASHYAAR